MYNNIVKNISYMTHPTTTTVTNPTQILSTLELEKRKKKIMSLLLWVGVLVVWASYGGLGGGWRRREDGEYGRRWR